MTVPKCAAFKCDPACRNPLVCGDGDLGTAPKLLKAIATGQSQEKSLRPNHIDKTGGSRSVIWLGLAVWRTVKTWCGGGAESFLQARLPIINK
jgi:hypothetical protein